MTITIETVCADKRGDTLFDIEYYLTKSDPNKNVWHSELHCLPCVRGIANFVARKALSNDENFDLGQFINDAEVIQELRGWLYEVEGNKDSKEHYTSRYTAILEIIKSFTDKYELYVNID